MSVFSERSELIETLEFKWGRARGRLAAANDILSDLAVTLGTHAAYCQAARQSTRVSSDLTYAQTCLRHAKELLASLLEEQPRESGGSSQ